MHICTDAMTAECWLKFFWHSLSRNVWYGLQSSLLNPMGAAT
jgi:hypothetical protein